VAVFGKSRIPSSSLACLVQWWEEEEPGGVLYIGSPGPCGGRNDVALLFARMLHPSRRRRMKQPIVRDAIRLPCMGEIALPKAC
jgi:hypothetical protein